MGRKNKADARRLPQQPRCFLDQLADRLDKWLRKILAQLDQCRPVRRRTDATGHGIDLSNFSERLQGTDGAGDGPQRAKASQPR